LAGTPPDDHDAQSDATLLKDPLDEHAMTLPEPGAAAALIALDWGTSSLRAWLLDSEGRVLEQRQAPRGIMQVQDADFAAVLEAFTGDWRQRYPDLRAVAAGMIGSAQGWVEARYLPCPAGPEELADALVSAPGGALLIVPGVAQYGDAPNVMRGEETQIAGALGLRPLLRQASRLLLPGTHSKWVEIAGGRIARFETFMTGELFAVLRNHSILGRLAQATSPVPEQAEAAFLRGVEAVRAHGRVAPLLFSARALALTGGLPAELTLDYLSGLLIGDEIASALQSGAAPDALIGDPALCRRYRLALTAFGVTACMEIDNAAIAGLWGIATQAGIATGTRQDPQ
jgi:2-dehydro-3-deoxygalactonokinase